MYGWILTLVGIACAVYAVHIGEVFAGLAFAFGAGTSVTTAIFAKIMES